METEENRLTASEQEYIKQIYLGTAEKNVLMHTHDLAVLIGARPASVETCP